VTQLLSAKGGFGNTYEALDAGGNPKVLKVLTNTEPKAIALFQQEARVLQQLHHPGIPKGESYFIYHPRDSEIALHCLIMEKIEGIDLEEYARERKYKPIAADLALDWLTQLANILHEVHRRKFFHRDIKPSNIILKPDGQLVLIDFGAARQVTKTVLSGQKNTGIYTPGYAPPEQSIGHSVPQSDFYALGKTLVFLLTGKEPDDPKIYEINTNQFQWRKYAPNLPDRLADFLDQLMAEKPIDRPANTSILLRQIEKLKSSDPNARSTPKTGLLSKLEALSRNRPSTSPSPDPTPAKTPPKAVPVVPQASLTPAGFGDRLKASILDFPIVIALAALAGGYLCFKAQNTDFVNQFTINFNRLTTLPLLSEIPFRLNIPRSEWIYYAAGTSALGTTIWGLAIAIAGGIYHLKTQTPFLVEEVAILSFLLVGIVIKWLYFVLFEVCFKATIGKFFLDLSVTDANGKRVSLGRANRRYWLKILSAVPLYLGFLSIGWTKKKSALHDRITSTRVLRDK
jgi:serine/threonine protein kinase